MKPINEVSGRAYPLSRDNVDTDMILPGRYLKTVTRTGLGRVAFEPLRVEADNIFDDHRYAGAPILIAGKNFGCGSSREHAVWALADMGVRVVIAESFSDIFAGNAFKNGILAISLSEEQIALLMAHAVCGSLLISLERQEVATADGNIHIFEIDTFRKDCLLKGLDEIELTLEQAPFIASFEARHFDQYPWLTAA
jgi:3-isopropylmalate/(R)-2-methylmalate dehydratase small subunit